MNQSRGQAGPWRERNDDEPGPEQISVGDRIRLIHEDSGKSIRVEVDHADPEENVYGGIVKESTYRPLIEPGDHVHFRFDQALND